MQSPVTVNTGSGCGGWGGPSGGGGGSAGGGGDGGHRGGRGGVSGFGGDAGGPSRKQTSQLGVEVIGDQFHAPSVGTIPASLPLLCAVERPRHRRR
eukprot:6476727-Prymnesium_polylepis.2